MEDEGKALRKGDEHQMGGSLGYLSVFQSNEVIEELEKVLPCIGLRRSRPTAAAHSHVIWWTRRL